MVIVVLTAILVGYFVLNKTLYSSRPEITPMDLKSNGVYVFQYKGLNKLKSAYCELTQVLFFIDQNQVFKDELDEIVEIDKSKVREFVNDIRRLDALDKRYIGVYSRDRNLIRITFEPGNGTRFLYTGGLTDFGMLVDVDVEYIDWIKGGYESQNVFKNVKYIFVPQ